MNWATQAMAKMIQSGTRRPFGVLVVPSSVAAARGDRFETTSGAEGRGGQRGRRAGAGCRPGHSGRALVRCE